MPQVLIRDAAGQPHQWIDHSCLDEIVTYAFSVTNQADGDGVITITATGSDGSTQNINLAEESGTYLSGQPTINTAGLVTFPTADDLNESTGSVTLDLAALISTDHPAWSDTATIDVTYDAATNTWSAQGAQVAQAVNGTVTTTTLTQPSGASISWDSELDTNTTNVSLILDSTDPTLLRLIDSDNNTLTVDLKPAIYAALDSLTVSTCP